MRQTGGALGVAILGSLIAANAFVNGMRWALVISAVAYGLALVLTLLFMGARGARVPLAAEPASST